MPGRMEFEFEFGNARKTVQQRPDSPMRILIMGDFSGKTGRILPITDKVQIKQFVIPVDFDNFERVMQRLSPQLDVRLNDEVTTTVNIQFTKLDDFHPDVIYEELGLFSALRDTRQRLRDPVTFPEAAAHLQSAAQNHHQINKENSQVENKDDLLKRLLGSPANSTHEQAVNTGNADNGLQTFIDRIVAPHIIPESDPHQPLYIAAVDEAISQQMNAILHAPAFQALEAIWRATWWLLTTLDIGEDLKLYLLDISKEELATDITAANGQLETTQFYQAIIEQGIDTNADESWSLLVGNYIFGSDNKDLTLLAQLGAIASQAGGPFIAQADTSLIGCKDLVSTPNPNDWTIPDETLHEDWQALRQSPVASWIGLVMPRVLLRLPYGLKTDEIETFAFEEITHAPDHHLLLWGNPAFACAQLIASSFLEQGWDMEPGDLAEITDLPAYIYEEDEEKKMQACAELYLSERAAQLILENGIMPIVSYRDRNSARLLRFQSISNPVTPLSGFTH